MATRQIIRFIFLSSLTFLASSDVFDSILDDPSSCIDVCSNTYAPHTFEKNYLNDSCNRGCRLFTVIEFVYDCINRTREVCASSCEEAYSKTDEQDACKLGCNSQEPFSIQDDQMEEEDGPVIHLLSPLMYFQNMYNQMFDRMYHSMSVSWSVYMKDDDGTVYVAKSGPTLYTDIGDDLDEYKTANYLETNIEAIDNAATPMLKNSQMKPLRNYDDDTIDLSVRDLHGARPAPVEEDSNNWLSCVAKKTGMPRVLLTFVLLFCACMMIWLCLTAAVTAPEQRVVIKPEKLSINGDQEVINALLAKGIKPSYPQARVHTSALPIKIKVETI